MNRLPQLMFFVFAGLMLFAKLLLFLRSQTMLILVGAVAIQVADDYLQATDECHTGGRRVPYR